MSEDSQRKQMGGTYVLLMAFWAAKKVCSRLGFQPDTTISARVRCAR